MPAWGGGSERAWHLQPSPRRLAAAFIADPTPAERLAAADGLMETKSAEVAPLLLARVGGPDPFVRTSVPRALIQRRWPAAPEPALVALRAREPDARCARKPPRPRASCAWRYWRRR